MSEAGPGGPQQGPNQEMSEAERARWQRIFDERAQTPDPQFRHRDIDYTISPLGDPAEPEQQIPVAASGDVAKTWDAAERLRVAARADSEPSPPGGGLPVAPGDFRPATEFSQASGPGGDEQQADRGRGGDAPPPGNGGLPPPGGPENPEEPEPERRAREARERRRAIYEQVIEQAFDQASPEAIDEAIRALDDLAIRMHEGETTFVSAGQGMTVDQQREVNNIIRRRLGIGVDPDRLNDTKIDYPRRRTHGEYPRERRRLLFDPVGERFKRVHEANAPIRNLEDELVEDRIFLPKPERMRNEVFMGRGRFDDESLTRTAMVERWSKATKEDPPRLLSTNIFVLPAGAFREARFTGRQKQTVAMTLLLEKLNSLGNLPLAEVHGDPGEVNRYNPGEEGAGDVGNAGYDEGPMAAERKAERTRRGAAQQEQARLRQEEAGAETRVGAEPSPGSGLPSGAPELPRAPRHPGDAAAEEERLRMGEEARARQVFADERGLVPGQEEPAPSSAAERSPVDLRSPELQDGPRLAGAQKDYEWAMQAAEPYERARRLGAVAERLERDNLAAGLGFDEGLAAGGLRLEHTVADAEVAKFVNLVANQWQESYRILRAEQLATAVRTFEESTGDAELPQRVSELIEQARKAGIYVEDLQAPRDADALRGRPSGAAARDLSARLNALAAKAAQRADRAQVPQLAGHEGEQPRAAGEELPMTLQQLAADLQQARAVSDPAERLQMLRRVARQASDSGLVERVSGQGSQYKGNPELGDPANELAARLGSDLLATSRQRMKAKGTRDVTAPQYVNILPSNDGATSIGPISVEDTATLVRDKRVSNSGDLRRIQQEVLSREIPGSDRVDRLNRIFAGRGVELRLAEAGGVEDLTEGERQVREELRQAAEAGFLERGGVRTAYGDYKATEGEAEQGERILGNARRAWNQVHRMPAETDADSELFSELVTKVHERQPEWQLPEGAMEVGQVRQLARQTSNRRQLSAFYGAIARREGIAMAEVGGQSVVQPKAGDRREVTISRIFNERDLELRLLEAGRTRDLDRPANRARAEQELRTALESAALLGYLQDGGEVTDYGDYRANQGASREDQALRREGERLLNLARRSWARIHGEEVPEEEGAQPAAASAAPPPGPAAPAAPGRPAVEPLGAGADDEFARMQQRARERVARQEGRGQPDGEIDGPEPGGDNGGEGGPAPAVPPNLPQGPAPPAPTAAAATPAGEAGGGELEAEPQAGAGPAEGAPVPDVGGAQPEPTPGAQTQVRGGEPREYRARGELNPDELDQALANNFIQAGEMPDLTQRREFLDVLARTMARRGVWRIGRSGRPEAIEGDDLSADRVEAWNDLYAGEEAGGSAGIDSV